MAVTRDRGEVRDRLVAAAAEVIAEAGWGEASTRRVADRAGLTPGLVHYHVAGIQELRRLAALRGTESVFAGPVAAAFDQSSPRDAVAVVFEVLSSRDARDPDLVLLYESLVASTRDGVLRAAIGSILADFRAAFAEWLTVRNVAQAPAVAATITAALDGFLLQRALDPTLSAEPLVRQLQRLV